MSLFSGLKSKNTDIGQKSLPGLIRLFSQKKSINLLSQKGTPRCTSLPAVFTLEAAVVLPLTACFFVSILFLFRVMQVQLEVQKALDDTGRKLAVVLVEEKDAEELAEFAVTKALFSAEMLDRKCAQRYIKGGSAGISLAKSRLSKHEVCLKASYKICLPVRLLTRKEIQVVQKADCRKWTGWNPATENANGDVWVYITETGTVYHTTKSCTHLSLSIQSVEYDEVAEMRNENGEKYRECLLCADKNNKFGRVYITNQGECFHKDLNCSGIKRTIFMIRLSEIGTRRACSKCGSE